MKPCCIIFCLFPHRQGSPIGEWGWYPLPPPGEYQQNLQNWLNQGFFENFLVNLIHNDLNDTKMDFFDVGFSIDPLDPQVTPLDPPGGRSIGDPCSQVYPSLAYTDCPRRKYMAL